MQIPAKKLSDAKLVLDRERPELNPERPQDRPFYVERDEATHQTLVTDALSAVANKRPFRWFFTGHTGAGKSTELNRIIYCQEIASRFIPHMYRVRDCLDVNNLDFTDLILGMGQSVAAIAEERKLAVSRVLRQRMARWGTETELESELGVSAEGKGGLEFNVLMFKATAEIQAGGEKRTKVREKLRESLTDFINLIDDLVAAIEGEFRKRVLIVIDTLDHVDHRPIRDIFTNHWASLSKPKVSVLTVIPLPMLHEKQFMAEVQNKVSLLPNINVYTGPDGRKLAPAGYKFFCDVIARLADLGLFRDEALRELFRLSGGMVRDMIGFAGDACKYADMDDPEGKVGPRHVQSVLDERKAFFRRLLSPADYEVLRRVAENPRPLGIEGLGPLLHLKAVIYYPNGEGWYGLHPAVQAILDDGKR